MSITLREAATSLTVVSEIEKHPYVFHCDKQWCHYHVCADSLEDAQTIEITHLCPSTGQTKNGWSVIMPGVIYLWEEIDKKYDEFAALPKDAPSKDLLGAHMRGMCESLSYFMKPYYETADAVIREVVERSKAYKAGMKRHTAGIGNSFSYPSADDIAIGRADEENRKFFDHSEKYALNKSFTYNPADESSIALAVAVEHEAHYGSAGSGRAAPSKRQSTATATAPVKHHFSDAEIEKIKTFHANGFTPEDLARVHGVSVAVIRSALAS